MKKNLRILLAAACMAMFFVGCSNPTTPDTENGNGTNTTVPGEPEFGGCIRVHSSTDPDALHPYASTTGAATYVKELIFQYLYDFHPETRQMVPVLAKDFAEISEDGLAFTFEIREEAKWDNGDPVTGEDYAFSVKSMFNPLSEAPHIRGYYSFIKEVQVNPNNKRKFTVLTDEPFFLSEYAVAGFEIISKNFYDPKGYLDNFTIPQMAEGDAVKDHPDLIAFSTEFHSERNKREPEGVYGSGPYTLQNWTTGSNVTLERKKDWWGYSTGIKGWPFEAYADKIIFKMIPDRPAALQAAAAGEIDVMRDVPGEEFTKFRNDPETAVAKQFKLETPDSYSYVYIGLNGCPPAGRTPVLEDKRVRRAMAHLTDVDRIIKSVYNGYGSRVVGPISPHNVNEYNTEIKEIEFDVETAKSLLDEAGWVDNDGDGIREKMIAGKKTPLEIKFLIPSSSSTAPRMANIIGVDAKKAGVLITPRKVEFTKLTESLKQHQFDMFGAAFNGSPLPKDLRQVWHTESWVNRGSNYTCFGNEESDSLIMKIRVTLDAEARKPLYYKIQEMIQDWQPMIFLMAPQERILIHKRFQNAKATTVRPGYKIQQFWTPKADQKCN